VHMDEAAEGLQYVAVFCSFFAVCRSLLQCVVLQKCCSVLQCYLECVYHDEVAADQQCVAGCCSVLLRFAVCCCVLQCALEFARWQK